MFVLPGPGVHAPTLLLSMSVFGLLLAGLSFSDSSALPEQRKALRWWGRAMLAIGLASLLFYMRGYLPWTLSFGLANVLLLALPLCGLRARAQLLRWVLPKRSIAGVAVFGLAGVLATGFFGVAPQWGIFALSLAFAGLHALTAALLLRDFARQRLRLVLVDALLVAFIAGAFALRAVRVLVGDVATLTPESASGYQLGVLLLATVCIVGTTLAFHSMVHASQREALLEAFRRDGLTGVYSRCAFFERAAERLQQHPTLRHAVVMVDLDRFKQVNDTFGHAGGDVTLVHAARAMGIGLRSVDLLGRYGGEEFCMLLSGCDEAEALALAQRLVQAARAQQVRLPDGRTVAYTLSAGCAGVVGLGPHGDAQAALHAAVERADAALYRAKQAGRDRAEAASATLLTSPARPTAAQSA